MSDLPDNSRTNLIINYLPQTLSDAEFNQLFAALGPLQSARILRDKRTGYSFGYGFVNYQKEEDATRGKHCWERSTIIRWPAFSEMFWF